jgi:hypothetical protein
MQCPKCGRENPDDTRFCNSCGRELAQVATTAKRAKVQVSKAAIASFTCSLVALVCFVPGLIAIIDPGVLNPSSEFVINIACASILAGAAGFLLAVLALCFIAGSGGRLSGRGFATVGAAIPPILVFVLYCFGIGGLGPPSARRMFCGTNLSGLGKAMIIYCGDYDEELPIAGGTESVWAARIADWKAASRAAAYGVEPDGTGGRASISSSLYLLVKYMEVRPKMFVCPQDAGTKEFVPRKHSVDDNELVNLWDFGPDPAKHCSYSYHLPYGAYPLSTSSQPGIAVASDRNPWIASPFAEARDFSLFVPDIAPFNAAEDYARLGNSRAHAGDGQNVLFLDSHVSFEKRSFCGIENDNIFTCWNRDDRIRGAEPGLSIEPAEATDSVLVNDPVPSR